MAGGPTSPELVIASCDSGALGSIGAAYLKPEEIEEFVSKVRNKTRRSLAINLFIPHTQPQISQGQLALALATTEKYRKQLGITAADLKAPYEENFHDQFETVLNLKPEVISFVFGLLIPEYIKEAKKKDIILIGTATTLEEALALQDSGVDAITLQGFEAGGHRGMFFPDVKDPEVLTFDLVERCDGKIKVPIIAAGGIMDSQDIQKLIIRGATAVQMGTAFLACEEAGTSGTYKRALLAARTRKTKMTTAFSGRWARGIENQFMLAMDSQPESILPFPAQNKFTRDLRTAALSKDNAEFLSLWCGSGQGELWTGSAEDLINNLFSN